MQEPSTQDLRSATHQDPPDIVAIQWQISPKY